MAEYVQQRLDEIHARLPAGLLIRTAVLTPDGVRIAASWTRRSPDGCLPVTCEVMDTSLDLVLRRVLLLEDDLIETERGGG